MSNIAKDSLIGRIRERYATLSPAERRAADLLLDAPGRVAGHTATELARTAGVSKMTISRLVRRLGFDGYEHMRQNVRDAGVWGSPQFLISENRPEGATADYNEHLQASHAAIDATIRLNSPDLLARAVTALAGAATVWLHGVRNNAAFASYARWQFIQVRPRVQMLAHAGETLAESLSTVTPQDLLLVMGIRRRPPALIKLLEVAAARGVPVLLLTDAHSPLECTAPPLTLLCSTRSQAALDNHAAVLAVVHALAAGLIIQLGAESRTRIAQIEALHDDLAEL
jgi:DNA-binding MurR/RpiR family transcriptional regulator